MGGGEGRRVVRRGADDGEGEAGFVLGGKSGGEWSRHSRSCQVEWPGRHGDPSQVSAGTVAPLEQRGGRTDNAWSPLRASSSKHSRADRTVPDAMRSHDRRRRHTRLDDRRGEIQTASAATMPPPVDRAESQQKYLDRTASRGGRADHDRSAPQTIPHRHRGVARTVAQMLRLHPQPRLPPSPSPWNTVGRKPRAPPQRTDWMASPSARWQQGHIGQPRVPSRRAFHRHRALQRRTTTSRRV